MMVCSNCGNKVNSSAKFCKKCGCKVEHKLIDGKKLFIFPIIYLFMRKKWIIATISTVIIVALAGMFIKNAKAISEESDMIKYYKDCIAHNGNLIDEYNLQKEQEIETVRNEKIDDTVADAYGLIGNVAGKFGDATAGDNAVLGIVGWTVQGLSEYAEEEYRKEDENIRQNRMLEIEDEYNYLIDDVSYDSEDLQWQILEHVAVKKTFVMKNALLLLVILMLHSGLGFFCMYKNELI